VPPPGSVRIVVQTCGSPTEAPASRNALLTDVLQKERRGTSAALIHRGSPLGDTGGVGEYGAVGDVGGCSAHSCRIECVAMRAFLCTVLHSYTSCGDQVRR
jgi:hypothetical protein